jgi:cytochrome c553
MKIMPPFKLDLRQVCLASSAGLAVNKDNLKRVVCSLLKVCAGLIVVCGLCLFVTCPVSAQTTESQRLNQAALAATCASCHGTQGHGVPDTGVPIIAAQSATQLLLALKAYKTGERSGTIMPQIVKGFSDEQLDVIARFLGKS